MEPDYLDFSLFPEGNVNTILKWKYINGVENICDHCNSSGEKL